MRECTVEVSNITKLQALIEAFKCDFCACVGGHRNGTWNAMHDYLSRPDENSFGLRLSGWHGCLALAPQSKQVMPEIFAGHPHVCVVYT